MHVCFCFLLHPIEKINVVWHVLWLEAPWMAMEEAKGTRFIMENPGWFERRGRGWREGAIKKQKGLLTTWTDQSPLFTAAFQSSPQSLVNDDRPWKHSVQINSILESADESQGRLAMLPAFPLFLFYCRSWFIFYRQIYFFPWRFGVNPFWLIHRKSIHCKSFLALKIEGFASLLMSQPAVWRDHFPLHRPLYCEIDIVYWLFSLRGRTLSEDGKKETGGNLVRMMKWEKGGF